ncbi:MAG TPA: ribonucleotide reductase N-terminal alpha domain-containing protein, partial [Candidatus Wallbacteria bacterium]|nr:ribonucleotide reductase N-terminal alpha domain-containing protein [Candidatus Wallbacteria bacterium]
MKRTLSDKKIELTTNAKIVLEKRYLKPNETPENLLWRVARNVALADIIYDKNIGQNSVFKNVTRSVTPGDHDAGTGDNILLFNDQNVNADWLKGIINQYISTLEPDTVEKPEIKKVISGILESFTSSGKKNYDENFKQFLENL